LTRAGKPDKALTQPRRPQEIAQGHESYIRAGLNYYQRGDLEKAAQAMEIASKLAPANIAYHYNLGLVYSELGQDKEAVREWEAVLKLDPDHTNARMLVNMKKK
jgi:tetratricopeptide (TPR) repeat protein